MNQKARILIVDDTPSNIKILHDLLKGLYSISVATSGADALDLIEKEAPDIILLDIMMPEMDGYEVCHRLKSSEVTAKIPVIFVTALDEMEDEEKGLKLGAVDYISKPISPPITLARIKNHLALKKVCDNLEEMIAERTQELEQAYADLKTSHEQVVHQEKLASIGQLAAGVAHEINNPTGYISSNLSTLQRYLNKLDEFHQAEHEVFQLFDDAKIAELKQLKKSLKIDFILEDTSDLVAECLEGSSRINKIVMGLKDFSRKDEDNVSNTNINDCLDNTLNVVWNEIKYKATVQKEYGDLPILKCYPQQLSQVFMNLLVNAAHAIEQQGTITIKTWSENDSIWISIDDTGSGIKPENLDKIFEAFFTTKEMGKGTGLGMSIASEIIKKHKGEIKVESEVGQGTTFTIQIPIID